MTTYTVQCGYAAYYANTVQGEPPTVIVEGGVVRDVVAEGGNVLVLVKDHDTKGLDPEVHDIRHGKNDDAYTLTDPPSRSP